MNIRDVLVDLADRFGNANITLCLNDDETWTASVWADTRTVLTFTRDDAKDATDALLVAISQMEPKA